MTVFIKSVLAIFFFIAFICMCVAYTRYAEPAGEDGKEKHVWLNTIWGFGLIMFFVFGLIVLLYE